MIACTIEDVYGLERDHKVEHIVILAFTGRGSVLDCKGRLVVSDTSIAGMDSRDSLAPTAMSTIVEPALFRAFQRPKAVPMHACDGTSSGIEAMNGICEDIL